MKKLCLDLVRGSERRTVCLGSELRVSEGLLLSLLVPAAAESSVRGPRSRWEKVRERGGGWRRAKADFLFPEPELRRRLMGLVELKWSDALTFPPASLSPANPRKCYQLFSLSSSSPLLWEMGPTDYVSACCLLRT